MQFKQSLPVAARHIDPLLAAVFDDTIQPSVMPLAVLLASLLCCGRKPTEVAASADDSEMRVLGIIAEVADGQQACAVLLQSIDAHHRSHHQLPIPRKLVCAMWCEVADRIGDGSAKVCDATALASKASSNDNPSEHVC